MGRLKDRKIVQTRIYLDGKQDQIPVFDYDYTFPKTVYDAIHKTFDDDSITLTEEINAIYRLISEKQPMISGGRSGTLMTWSGIDGVIGETEIVKYIDREPSLRSNTKVPSERAVGEMMDTKVSAATFEAHARDSEIHVTQEDKDNWNSKANGNDFSQHIHDEHVHITMDERENWNKKANQDDLEKHILDINNPHDVTAHQVGTYTRREIDEMIKEIRDSFFNYKNIDYDDRTNTARLVEYDSINWNPNYILAHGDELPDVSDPTLTYFALRPATDYSTDETQDCMIYVKKPGLVWQEVGIQEMSPGDLVIRYFDTQMYVWMQGRFINLFNGSAADDDSESSESILMWRPIISPEGIITWTRSTEITAPDPMTIKGPPGETPVKGVDYFDGADGEGVPEGGGVNDILVKLSDEDYDSAWKSMKDVLGDYILAGGGLPDGLVTWDSIYGKPEWYTELGDNDDGFVTQKVITEHIVELKRKIQEIISTLENIDIIDNKLNAHMNDYNNPHRVTPAQIGAVSNTTFLEHITNTENPHNVTLDQLGIPNVDNTSDLDKPISNATQDALDKLTHRLGLLQDDVGRNNFVSNVTWEDKICTITFNYRDGTELAVEIPIIPIFKSIYFDDVNSELVIVLPNKDEHRIDIKHLVTKYIGTNSENIKVEVDTDGFIKATILPDSVTGEEIVASVNLRESPTTTTQPVGDRSVRIATTEFVKSIVIDNLISYETDRPLSANMGRILNQKKADIEDVLQIIRDMNGIDVIDHLESSNEIAALSANMGRYLNLTKAPKVHTSPSGSTFGRATVDLFGHTRSTNVDPLMDGIPFVGTDDGYYARGDHRHPTDTTRAPMHWPDEAHNQYEFTGEPKTPTPMDDSNDHHIANTEWVRRNAVGCMFGKCHTRSDDPVKIVTLESSFMDKAVFMRQKGSTIAVTFDYSSDINGVTYIDAQGTGPAQIMFGGLPVIPGMIKGGYTYLFTFNGSHWILENPSGIHPLDDSDNSSSLVSSEWVRRNAVGAYEGYCSSAGSNKTKTVILRSSFLSDIVFIRQIGSIVSVYFNNKDTSSEPTMLKVGSSDAREIKYGGNPLVKGMIGKHHMHEFVFDGEYWWLINPVSGGTTSGGITIGPGKEEDPDEGTPDLSTSCKILLNPKAKYSAGDIVEYNIIITNTGDGAANDVTFIENPVNLDIVSMIKLNDNSSVPVNGFGDYIVGTVDVGESVIIRGTFRIRGIGEFRNAISIGKTEIPGDPNTADGPDFSPSSKTLTTVKEVYRVGDKLTYSIAIINRGTEAARNVRLTEAVTNLEINSVERADGTKINKNSSGAYPVGNIGVGEIIVVVVEVTIKTTGPFTNTATIIADNYPGGKPLPSTGGTAVEAIIINKPAGYFGFTTKADGSEDANGQVSRVWFAINFTPTEGKLTVKVSDAIGAFSAKMGDNSTIILKDPKIVECTESNVIIQFTMNNSYPSNSPCQLMYRTDAAWLDIDVE